MPDPFYLLHSENDDFTSLSTFCSTWDPIFSINCRMAGVLAFGTMDVRLENPGGLTGVWAEENTRASIWDAMYRKEIEAAVDALSPFGPGEPARTSCPEVRYTPASNS